jgi:hypothetical protein
LTLGFDSCIICYTKTVTEEENSMSLEEVIKEQTAAIKEQTLVLQKLVTAIAVNVAGKKFGTESMAFCGAADAIPLEAVDRRYAVVEDVPAPAAEKTKPKKAAPKSEELQMMEEVIAEEATFKLPDGERNDAYYVQHVQPICLELVTKNKPALFKIVNERFGAKSAKLIPADKWDELVAAVKAEL